MTTNSIQGDQGRCPLVNTVPTHEFAFTNNLGRTVVRKTRAAADVAAAAELLPLPSCCRWGMYRLCARYSVKLLRKQF